MRVLWLCNIMLPLIAQALGRESSNKEGWLAGLSDRILAESRNNEIELGVCFPVTADEESLRGKVQGISYYGFSEDTVHPERYDSHLEQDLQEILEDFKPDVVHCFGTEYPHTLAMTRAWNRPERTLIGIQGLCFVYADHYMADLPLSVQNGRTFRDVVKCDDLRKQQQKFRERGAYEKEALENTLHVTGRTRWDQYWTNEVNPEAQYHFMNETLRANFYGKKWELEKCRRHSIFLSQGNYPIKGLHYMLGAMPEILKQYPDAHVYVAGDEITRFGTLREKIKISGYGAYLRRLIGRNHLSDHVTFLGRLNAEQMLAQYLQSNVFVSPSSIENSPNSVGEAMLLGMPVISSDVGGVRDMLEDGREGWLYDTSDVDRLAGLVCHVFAQENESEVMGVAAAAAAHAGRTHDPDVNYTRLMEIYHEINVCV